MYIKIKNCIPSDYEDDDDRFAVLERIINSYGRRYNIVSCSNSILINLVEAGFYGRLTRKYAEELIDNKRHISSIKSKVDFHIIVDFSLDDLQISISTNGNIEEITCSYHYFSDPTSELGGILLSENRRDCNFYEHVGEMFTRSVAGSKYKVSLQHKSGNGSETHSEFVQFRQENKLLLCIVDNDKAHPRKGEGSTSSHFGQHLRTLGAGFEVYVLPVREIESIIPQETIADILTSKIVGVGSPRVSEEARNLGYSSDSIDVLDKIIQLDGGNNEFRTYFDHKDGLTLRKALELDRRFNSFWKPYFRNERLYNIKDCRPTGACPHIQNQDNCECIKLKGLGSNILEHSLPYLKTSHYPSLIKNMPADMQAHWASIGQRVMSWGCSVEESKDRAP